ncbi:helix-turn-helix domain-containing protein [Flintibacter muris]|uniref:helix-turn-helix domain-containing protein n=1 Tax=Flintibacter muris TaxID=2941327 RepID=UPI00203F26F8|nr:helix-turn-helix domain-containing protein [Flintibacter muris]
MFPQGSFSLSAYLLNVKRFSANLLNFIFEVSIMVDKIRRLCQAQGKSLFSLEKECGLGNGTINKWDRNSPSVAKVAAVADALGVSVSYLIGEQEKKPAPTDGDGPTLDASLIERLIQLTPEEREKVEVFVQGMIAGRDAHGSR